MKQLDEDIRGLDKLIKKLKCQGIDTSDLKKQREQKQREKELKQHFSEIYARNIAKLSGILDAMLSGVHIDLDDILIEIPIPGNPTLEDLMGLMDP